MDDLLCYICLLNDDQDTAAVTLVGGTAVCREHIRAIANSDILGFPAPDLSEQS